MVSPPRFDLVVIAASADGIDAIGRILSALPADWSVPIAIVQHRTSVQPNRLPELLGRRTPLAVRLAEAGEPLRPGRVYVAHPESHLVLCPDRTLACRDGTRIRHLRSSAIPLLTSASEVLGKRLIAVVLTGSGRDGTDGVQSVHARGGVVIAQDPATVRYSHMPAAAIASGAVTQVLPVEKIGPALIALVREGSPNGEKALR